VGQHVRMTRSGKVLRTAGTATAGLGLLALIWAGVTTPAFAGTSGSGNDPLLCVLGICIGGGSGGSGSSSSPSPSAAAASPTATSAPGLTKPSPSASSAAGNGSGTGNGNGTGTGSGHTGTGTGKVSSASPSASAPAPSASQSGGTGLQALADAASTTPNAAAGQPKELPTTSAPTIPVGGTGLALAAGGVVLLVVSRKRRVSA
jgi:hypothetical protein